MNMWAIHRNRQKEITEVAESKRSKVTYIPEHAARAIIRKLGLEDKVAFTQRRGTNYLLSKEEVYEKVG